MLFGIAVILFGFSFAFLGEEGIFIALFLASVGLFVCFCGLILEHGDRKKD